MPTSLEVGNSELAAESSSSMLLHRACVRNKTKLLQYLIEIFNIKDFDTKDEFGDTALHISVRNNNSEACLVLCKHGARTDIFNNQKLTAIQLARKCGFGDVVSVLSQFQDDHTFRDTPRQALSISELKKLEERRPDLHSDFQGRTRKRANKHQNFQSETRSRRPVSFDGSSAVPLGNRLHLTEAVEVDATLGFVSEAECWPQTARSLYSSERSHRSEPLGTAYASSVFLYGPGILEAHGWTAIRTQ